MPSTDHPAVQAPFQTALQRFHTDPVLHARALQAVAITDGMAAKIQTGDGEVFYAASEQNVILMTATVALVLAEQPPPGAEPPPAAGLTAEQLGQLVAELKRRQTVAEQLAPLAPAVYGTEAAVCRDILRALPT